MGIFSKDSRERTTRLGLVSFTKNCTGIVLLWFALLATVIGAICIKETKGIRLAGEGMITGVCLVDMVVCVYILPEIFRKNADDAFRDKTIKSCIRKIRSFIAGNIFFSFFLIIWGWSTTSEMNDLGMKFLRYLSLATVLFLYVLFKVLFCKSYFSMRKHISSMSIDCVLVEHNTEEALPSSGGIIKETDTYTPYLEYTPNKGNKPK